MKRQNTLTQKNLDKVEKVGEDSRPSSVERGRPTGTPLAARESINSGLNSAITPTQLQAPGFKRRQESNLSEVSNALAKEPSLDKAKSDESSSVDLTPSEQDKLRKILRKIMSNGADADEKEQFVKIIADEWVDPTPDLIEGIFHVNQTNMFLRCLCRKQSSAKPKIVVYDYRSLYMFHFQSIFRKELVNFTDSTMFENFIILLIFLNSIILAVYDYNDRDNLTPYNQVLEEIGKVFTVAFAVEMILKILAMGFVVHKNAYLRDAWNWLDFVVVITGIMEMMELSWFKVRALRTLRVLRPLRSIKAFPKMRQLISSLVGSVNSLLNAVVFMLFIFMLFGILGIQQFGGTMYRRCRYSDMPLADGTWPYDEDADTLCSPDGQGLVTCPADQFCREPINAGLGSAFDQPQHQTLIFYNMLGFDNLAWAMLTIFQMITLESWTLVMYNLMDSNIWWMAIIFCVLLVIIGSFFLLNVILAVLADALNMVEKVQEQNQSVKLLAIRRSFERADRQEAKRLGVTYEEMKKQRKEEYGVVESQQPEERDKSQEFQGAEPLRDITIEDQGLMIHATDVADNSRHFGDHSRKSQDVHEIKKMSQVSPSEPGVDLNNMSPPHPKLGHQSRFTHSETKPDVDNQHPFRTDQEGGGSGHKVLSDAPKNVVQPTQHDPNNDFYDKDPYSSTSQLGDYTTQTNKSGVSTLTVIPERALTNRLYLVCFKLCTHWMFTLFITLLIVANTIVLALDKFPEDPEVTKITEVLNNFFTWAFVAEMIIKLFGLGFKEYTRDSFNIFDALIVVLSMIDLVYSASLGGGESQAGALSAFRGVRLLRVFKLARSWSSFREILQKIIITMKDVSTFSVLLLMFMFIFTLLGMELFGYKVAFDSDDRPIQDADGVHTHEAHDDVEYPRPNFNNIGMGFTSIFAIAIGDDWNYLMALAFRAQGGIAIGFYPLVFIFMNLILLNLFLAILLQNFETKDEEKDAKMNDSDEKTFKKFQRRLVKCFEKRCCECCKKLCCPKSEFEDSDLEDLDDKIMGSVKSSSIINLESDENIKMDLENVDEKDSLEEDAESLDDVEDDKKKFPSIIEEELSKEENENSQHLQSESNVGAGVSPRNSGGHRPQEDKSQSSILASNRKTPRQKRDAQSMRKKFTMRHHNSEQNITRPALRTISVDSNENDNSVSRQSDAVKSIPGNQQDSQGPAVAKDAPKDNAKKPRLKKSKTQKILQERKQMQKIMEKVPEEYNPENMLKVTGGKRLTSDKKKELLESQRLHEYTSKVMSLAQLKKLELIEKYGADKKKIQMIGNSCGLFSPQNILRRICFQIVKNSQYDNAVLLLIAASTVLLTMDNPNIDGNGELATILNYFDYVLTALFTLECMINIILFGFLLNGKTSYARDPWNIMDMVIVFFSIFNIILASQGGAADLSILKIFRMLRVLRPLRFLKRNLGLKIQVISLMNAIPGIFNLLLISALILMLFGIQAVGLLKGKLHYCETVNVPDYAIAEITTKWDCLDYGGEWVNPEDNFDDVVTAMVTMFGMMTTEGWLDVMWSAVDSTEIHQVPRLNNQPAFIIFFSIFMIIGSLFILNLFVGVVINVFNIEKEKLSHNNLLTNNQEEYCEVLIKCYTQRPQRLITETGSRYRDWANKLARSNAFEFFIFSCICLNTVVLALSWYSMDPDIIYVLEILNYFFTVIYTIEMVVKIIGFGRNYFRDGWCIFDFIIVISAWLGIFLLEVFDIDVGSISTIIRSFRIARVLKLIKTAKNLQQIFQTFILAIPELINVGALLMLFLFLFAVLGVSLFAEVKTQDTMDRHANFSNFGYAILTLLRVATGEGWVGIMYDAARQPSILFSCVATQTYASKVADGIQGCGSSAAYMYFIAFILIVSLVFLNLFIAIILEGFAASATEQSIRVGEEAFNSYVKNWRTYDPSATGMMDVNQLENLIMDLIVDEQEVLKKDKVKHCNFSLNSFVAVQMYTKWKRGLITDEDRRTIFKDFEKNKRWQKYLRRQMRYFIQGLEIPMYSGFKYIQFHDTLNGLIMRRYTHMHQLEVNQRLENIETKKEAGYQLVGLELIVQGSEEYWMLTTKEKEIFMEYNDPKFQSVVNRLEHKGKDNSIMKFNFMQRLRQMIGKRHTDQLDMYEDTVRGSDHNYVISTAHLVAGKTMMHYLHKKWRARKKREAKAKGEDTKLFDSIGKDPLELYNFGDASSSGSSVVQRQLTANLSNQKNAIVKAYASVGQGGERKFTGFALTGILRSASRSNNSSRVSQDGYEKLRLQKQSLSLKDVLQEQTNISSPVDKDVTVEDNDVTRIRNMEETNNLLEQTQNLTQIDTTQAPKIGRVAQFSGEESWINKIEDTVQKLTEQPIQENQKIAHVQHITEEELDEATVSASDKSLGANPNPGMISPVMGQTHPSQRQEKETTRQSMPLPKVRGNSQNEQQRINSTDLGIQKKAPVNNNNRYDSHKQSEVTHTVTPNLEHLLSHQPVSQVQAHPQQPLNNQEIEISSENDDREYQMHAVQSEEFAQILSQGEAEAPYHQDSSIQAISNLPMSDESMNSPPQKNLSEDSGIVTKHQTSEHVYAQIRKGGGVASKISDNYDIQAIQIPTKNKEIMAAQVMKAKNEPQQTPSDWTPQTIQANSQQQLHNTQNYSKQNPNLVAAKTTRKDTTVSMDFKPVQKINKVQPQPEVNRFVKKGEHSTSGEMQMKQSQKKYTFKPISSDMTMKSAPSTSPVQKMSHIPKQGLQDPANVRQAVWAGNEIVQSATNANAQAKQVAYENAIAHRKSVSRETSINVANKIMEQPRRSVEVQRLSLDPNQNLANTSPNKSDLEGKLQQASTIEHERSLHHMVQANFNKRDRSANAYDAKQAKRSMFLKAPQQDNDKKKKTPDTSVSRTLRKNNYQQSLNTGTRRGIFVDEEANLFSRIPSSRQQQITVFANTQKKAAPLRMPLANPNPTKTNMLWFSGSPQVHEPAPAHQKSNSLGKNIARARNTTVDGFNRQPITADLPMFSKRSDQPFMNSDLHLLSSNETRGQQRNHISSMERFDDLSIYRAALSNSQYQNQSQMRNKTGAVSTNGRQKGGVQVSSLMDENGNLSAAALAQLEPKGHSLLPQPFMSGISSLNEQINGRSNSPVKHRSNLAIQKQMVSKTSKGGSNYNSQGSKHKGAASRSASKNTQKKKKMLLDAYNLDQYNLI